MEANNTLIVKMYDFIKEIIPLINQFPRDQKFILGTKLENLCLETLELIIEAFYAPRTTKKEKVSKINISLEKIRYLLRMGYELHYYSLKKYSYFSEKLVEIGKMTGGWLKSLK